MRLLEVLEKRGITRTKLAMKTEISPANLYSAINGQKIFFPRWQVKIAKYLGIDRYDLFEEEIENNNFSRNRIKSIKYNTTNGYLGNKHHKLLKIINKLNFSVEKFSINVGISSSNFYKIIRFEKNFSDYYKLRISEFLDMKQEDIF